MVCVHVQHHGSSSCACISYHGTGAGHKENVGPSLHANNNDGTHTLDALTNITFCLFAWSHIFKTSCVQFCLICVTINVHICSLLSHSIAHTGCPICLEAFKNPKETKCGHKFCTSCIQKALSYDPYCPSCKTPLRSIIGKQPPGGTMTHKVCHDCV